MPDMTVLLPALRWIYGGGWRARQWLYNGQLYRVDVEARYAGPGDETWVVVKREYGRARPLWRREAEFHATSPAQAVAALCGLGVLPAELSPYGEVGR